MNQTFFQAIDRINLGTAVAIEYMGPFLVAALGKRSWRHFAWVVLALGGVLLLAHPSGSVSWSGLFFAGCAAAGWAAYAYASHFAGDATSGFGGLAVAMAIGAVLTFPLFPHSVAPLVSSGLVPRMVAASLLAVVIGFGAEMQALRGLPPSIVSVLLAGNPAVAFAVGYVVLAQPISMADVLGTLCVATAGIAVTRDATSERTAAAP
jgi:inner membrane transporter RhtA